jgi:hypothetical protein
MEGAIHQRTSRISGYQAKLRHCSNDTGIIVRRPEGAATNQPWDPARTEPRPPDPCQVLGPLNACGNMVGSGGESRESPTFSRMRRLMLTRSASAGIQAEDRADLGATHARGSARRGRRTRLGPVHRTPTRAGGVPNDSMAQESCGTSRVMPHIDERDSPVRKRAIEFRDGGGGPAAPRGACGLGGWTILAGE